MTTLASTSGAIKRPRSNMDALLSAMFPSAQSDSSQSSFHNNNYLETTDGLRLPHKKRISIADLISTPHDAWDLLVDSSSAHSSSSSSPCPTTQSDSSDGGISGNCCGATVPDIAACCDSDDHSSSCGAVAGSSMTSSSSIAVTLLYPKCAQKSYGVEKRFLCPPPLVFSSRPVAQISLTTSVDANQHVPELMAPVSSSSSSDCCHYISRQVYVPSNARDRKEIQLQLSFRHSSSTIYHMASGDVAMISKPSKKKYQKSGLLLRNGDSVCLFNRINSQTVRTRYMHFGSGLSARQSVWSPLKIEVDSTSDGSLTVPVLSFGSIISLRDVESNVCMGRLIVRKVERNIACDFRGPIGQMSKCCLVKADDPTAVMVAPTESNARHWPDHDGFDTDSIVFGRLPNSGDAVLSAAMVWTIVGVESRSVVL
eukprot:Partr_v1_DN26651_c0_g1_i3_m68830 putative recombination signal binding protein for immunoglobulin kappa J